MFPVEKRHKRHIRHIPSAATDLGVTPPSQSVTPTAHPKNVTNVPAQGISASHQTSHHNRLTLDAR